MRTWVTVLRSADRVLDAVALVQRLTACGLGAARELVERPGRPVTGPLGRSTADAVVALLARAGAHAEAVSAGEQLVFFRPDDPRGADQPLERLTHSGRAVLVEQGSLAGFAGAEPTTHADETAAERRFAEAVEARFAAGLLDADDAAGVHRRFAQRNAELDARLRAGDGEEAARVYADWLLERGDPRGELMALQLAGRAREAEAVLAAHRCHVLGGLAALGDRVSCEWEHGLLRALLVNPSRRRRQEPPDLGRIGRVAHWAGALATLPAAVALRTLQLVEDADLALGAGGLAVPATVERLLLWAGDGGTPIAVASPLAGLEHLTWLSLGLRLDDGGLAAPRVEHLELRGGALRARLEAVDPGRLPALRTLSLDLGEGEPLRFQPDALAFERLLERLSASRLAHLVLTATPRSTTEDSGFLRPVVEALLRWPSLDALETLELRPNLRYGDLRRALQRRVRLVEQG